MDVGLQRINQFRWMFLTSTKKACAIVCVSAKLTFALVKYFYEWLAAFITDVFTYLLSDNVLVALHCWWRTDLLDVCAYASKMKMNDKGFLLAFYRQNVHPWLSILKPISRRVGPVKPGLELVGKMMIEFVVLQLQIYSILILQIESRFCAKCSEIRENCVLCEEFQTVV